MRPQSTDIRTQKRLDAKARQEIRDSVSDETQLAIIAGRSRVLWNGQFGESKKEVARLQARIERNKDK